MVQYTFLKSILAVWNSEVYYSLESAALEIRFSAAVFETLRLFEIALQHLA